MHRYTVELRITGHFDPASLTSELGLTPTTQWRIGEAANPAQRDKATWGYAPTGQYRDWPDFQQMMSTLLDELDPIQEKFERLKSGHQAFFWCGQFASGFSGGPSFSPELLRRVAAYALPLYIETHFVHEQAPDIGCTP